MHKLLELLSGGDKRSIGHADVVVQIIEANPELIAIIFSGFNLSDQVLHMRCADVIEKVTRRHPQLLEPFKQQIIDELSTLQQSEVRWHLAEIFPRLHLSTDQRSDVINLLLSNMNRKSSILKTMSMQALTDIAIMHPVMIPTIKKHIEELSIIGTPAMKSRGRKLIASLMLVQQR